MKSESPQSIYTLNPIGSIWHRWEPHIHTPETILNNQFVGEDPWEDFLTRIENSSPRIKVLGITDYYSLENYSKILQFKKMGRLQEVELIFPNVELRYLIGTASNAAINGHLLISPEDPDHIQGTERFLEKLHFTNGRENYVCNRRDLIKLGRDHNSAILDDRKALEAGTNQFKVTFSQLLKEYKDSEWAQKNIILAVATGTNDGTSGLNNDSSFAQTRRFIERKSNILFTGNPNDRAFWIGKSKVSVDEIEREWDGLKPCINGSDAHTGSQVGIPTDNRFTWIKGDLIFESLRQICIEPDHRVFVGLEPPTGSVASNTIEKIDISNATWLTPQAIPLNSGLVTIIGARGSGKTALADLIATGAFAMNRHNNKTSFIQRAKEHLTDVAIKLHWGSGETSENEVTHIFAEDLFDLPRVQYLSQQFVEQLCSSEGATDELLTEIERVIFNSLPTERKLGFSSFDEMLHAETQNIHNTRVNNQELIKLSSDKITQEWTLSNELPKLNKSKEEKEKLIKGYQDDRTRLLSQSAQTNNVEALQHVTAAFEIVKNKLEKAKRQLASLRTLKQTVDTSRKNQFVSYIAKLKEDHTDANLQENEWGAFAIDFSGDVDSLLNSKIQTVEQQVNLLKGDTISPSTEQNKSVSLIPSGSNLENQSFELLSAETARLNLLIGIDKEKAKKISELAEKKAREESDLDRVNQKIRYANNCGERIKASITERNAAYREVFKTIIDEQAILNDLYLPLKKTLKESSETLQKLTFHVKRKVDVEKWAENGEGLLDLRKLGPFKGKGTLLSLTKQELEPIWENGAAEEIEKAIADFRSKHESDLLDHAQAERGNNEDFTQWINRFASWLYSTDHISLEYGIRYDGVDIQQLSPGTRGIVLLLLYLAIDKDDMRPLIIDQPEENLDPKSIFDELVPLFREAKSRRQIIIVTHNANLVVNADSDQVIVANAGSHIPGSLPNISYQSGGLENTNIRDQVCKILEGGETAFKERAKRLRVKINP